MNENNKPNNLESEVLKNYFNEFIRDRVYFNIRTLAIGFISDNTSLTYKQASSNDNLRGTIMRFSKIIIQAKRDEIIRKYNTNTYEIIKNVK